MRLRTLAALELRALASSRAPRSATVLFLLAGLAAIAQGRAIVQEQRRVLAAAPEIDARDAAYLGPLHEGQEAGALGYYLFRSAGHPPSPWSAVALGQRDVNAYALRVRLLGLESQLYDAELGNPLTRLAGSFDLAFVFALLAPLLLIALGYGVLADDQERKVLPLIRAQGGSLPHLLALRLTLRLATVLGASLLLQAVAVIWLELPIDGRFLDGVLVLVAYLVLWSGLIGLLAAWLRTPTVCALAMVGLWLATGVVAPAVANVALETFFPTPQGLELTVRQRMVVHDGWDRPRQAALEPFFRRRPHLPRPDVPTDRFSWTWYYANWEAGDVAVERLAWQYRDNLLARHRWTERLALFMPPVQAGLLWTRIAQTDLPARLDHLASVRRYHEQLKGFFYPRILAEAKIQADDLRNLPRHRFQPPWSPLPAPALVPFVLAFVLAVAATGPGLDRKLSQI